MRQSIYMLGRQIGNVQDMNKDLGASLEKPYRGSVYGIAPRYRVHVMDFDSEEKAKIFVEQFYIGTYIAM